MCLFQLHLFSGTLKERGITAWQDELQTGSHDNHSLQVKHNERQYKLAKVLYVVPGINKLAKHIPGFRFIPICPGYNSRLEE